MCGGMGEEEGVTGSSVGLIYSSLECVYWADCECSLNQFPRQLQFCI